MFRDIARYIAKCNQYQRFKVSQRKSAGKMHFTQLEQPWETVCSDFMGPFPRSTRGNTMLLLFHDKFTKWTEVIPLHAATTSALISAFRTHVLARFGFPKMLITDIGKQYVSNQFQELLAKYKIRQRFNAPYAPQTNPTERVNRVVKTMIAQYIQEDHRHWDEHLPELMFAINTAKHETTGFSPAFLNFGREPLLPTSLYAAYTKITNSDRGNPSQRLQSTLELVRINLAKAYAKQSHHYNLRKREWKPNIGKWIFIKTHHLSNATHKFTAKLAPKFDGPYQIIKFVSPVIVKIITEQRKIRTAHIQHTKPTTPPPNEVTSQVIANAIVNRKSTVEMERRRTQKRIFCQSTINTTATTTTTSSSWI